MSASGPVLGSGLPRLPSKVSCKPPPTTARSPGYPGAGGFIAPLPPPQPVPSSFGFSSAKCLAGTLRLTHFSSLFCPGFENSVMWGAPQTSTLQHHGVPQKEAVIKIRGVTEDQTLTRPQPFLGVCPFRKNNHPPRAGGKG